MKLSVKLFSQVDPIWKAVKLGTSTATIGSDGCLLSDVAMVCSYFGKDTDPQKLNTDLIRVKGFVNSQGGLTNAANLVYAAIESIYPDIKVDWGNFIDCTNMPAPLDKIDAILFSKRPVIVQVDYDTHTAKIDQHWVTIIGKTEEGAYLINDPIDGSEQFFQSRYGDPQRYIFRIVAYLGPITVDPNPEDRIIELEAKVKSLNEGVASCHLENNTLRTDLSTQERDNTDLTNQLTEARNKNDSLAWENSQLKNQVDTSSKALTSSQDELKALKLSYSDLQAQSVSALSKWQLFLLWIGKR